MIYNRIGVLINTQSGSFSAEKFQADDIKAEFAQYDHLFSDIQYFLSGKTLFKSQLEKLKEYNPDLAVAAGGDGTVGALVNSLSKRKTPIAIIPCGTFNHFATDAGVPLDMPAAVRGLFNGKQTKLDAVSLNGRIFINNSSIGLYPHSIEVREKLEKKYGHNRLLFLIIAFLRIFTRFPLYKITLKIDGKEQQHVTSSLFVGNNKYEVELLKFGSRESLQDGKLSLYFSNCRNRWRFIRNSFFLLLGKLKQAKNFEFLLADKVDVQTSKKQVRVSADGEILKLEPPLSYESLPGAVKIILADESHD